MSATPEPLQLQQLDTRIHTVWRRAQTLNGTAGALALFRWAIPLFLVGMAVDWITDMPAAGRVAVLVALLIVSSYKVWQCGWRKLRAFDAAHTALQLEEHHGGLDSLLVSAVQFRGPAAAAGTSEALRERTRRLAEEAAATLRPDRAVPYQGLRYPALLALALVVAIGVFAIVNAPLLVAGAGRIFAPWLAVEYPTYTQLDLGDGDRIVKEGEGVRLQARVSGVVPADAELTLRTGKGKPRVRSLDIAESVCEYKIEAAFRSFEYRIAAGDARSQWHSVQVVSSPRIERAEVSLEFPAYTQRPEETVEALTVTVPEGTRIHWRLTLDRAVSEAEYRPAEESPVPLDVSSDGRVVTMRQVAAESRAYSFGWVDREHGFAFDSPRHYVQVAPDRSPQVELTSPRNNLYATLQRKLTFAFRARDDHGIGETVLAYRVNKTAEVKVPLPKPTPSDGSEQRIDWDYRKALPGLAVGDALSFTVEVMDRYPGADGPHGARSDVRRVQFLSKEDYLKQVAKQKRRLLARLRAIYREERAVHNIVRSLDPSDDVFIQACQLEAVRQDLMRERLNALRRQMDGLVDDLAANHISDGEETASLTQLGSDLQTIADEHVGRAASMLRELTAVSDGARSGRDPEPAVHAVNSAARELALLVFQLGFRDAADVMARELHATAQTQASLRLRTIVQGDSAARGTEELAKAQTRLAAWCARLLAATPRNKESTSEDALVAFNLSRLAKRLLSSGADAKMRRAAALIPAAEREGAARLQAEVIAALLHAEFRLRTGAEYEALLNARTLLTTLAAGQKKLREENAGLDPDAFAGNGPEIAQSQAALHRELHLLLLPAIPAPRPRLFDAAPHSPPPVDDLLTSAESAMEAALARIKAGDREAAANHQQQAETAFATLAGIVSQRMEAMTLEARTRALVTYSGKLASQVAMLEERLLALLEKTEEAADDGLNTASLNGLNEALAHDTERFRRTIVRWNEVQATPNDDDLPLLSHMSQAIRLLSEAAPSLKNNQPEEAIELLEEALDALEQAGLAIAALTEIRTDFASVLATTENALTPSPQLAEIEAEQIDMTAITKKAKPEELPRLVIPQKNLIHAADAVLNSLDALAHKIESGTVLLFAKEDMDAAATGLETDDVEEALDAQSFVAESLQELRTKIDDITPQYRYVLEVSEFLYEIVPQSAGIQVGVRQLFERAGPVPDANVWKTKVNRFGSELQKLTGEQRFAATARAVADAIDAFEPDDPTAAESRIDDALDALVADTEALQTLSKNLAYLIAPPANLANIAKPSPEVKLLEDVLWLAAHQKDLSRRTHVATPEQLVGFASRQRKLESRCAALIPASRSHANLAAARRHLSSAAGKLEAADRAAALASQREAGEALRCFILEYALKYVDVPPPAPSEEGPPSDDPLPAEDELQLFMPGALTGRKPKGGRLEWQVIGRRERAALNENFARELPLEYRAILKDYYERLTQ